MQKPEKLGVKSDEMSVEIEKLSNLFQHILQHINGDIEMSQDRFDLTTEEMLEDPDCTGDIEEYRAKLTEFKCHLLSMSFEDLFMFKQGPLKVCSRSERIIFWRIYYEKQPIRSRQGYNTARELV